MTIPITSMKTNRIFGQSNLGGMRWSATASSVRAFGEGRGFFPLEQNSEPVTPRMLFGRASRFVLRKWWSTWRRVRTSSFSFRAWAARNASTIMSKSTARKKSGSSDLGHMLVLEATGGQAVLQG